MNSLKSSFLFACITAIAISSFAQSTDSPQETRKTKGYYSVLQLDVLMNRNSDDAFKASPAVSMVNGYMFNRNWAAGIGIGYDLYEYKSVPLFVDLRYSVNDNKIAPYFALKGGYSFGKSNSHYEGQIIYHNYIADAADTKIRGGVMLNPEIGVKIPMRGADLLFGIGYRYQPRKHETSLYKEYILQETVTGTSHVNRLSLSIAIMFR